MKDSPDNEAVIPVFYVAIYNVYGVMTLSCFPTLGFILLILTLTLTHLSLALLSK
jgi:hypothetical protein